MALPETHFSTRAIHTGQDPEQWKSRAVVPPISMSTTFQQFAPAKHATITSQDGFAARMFDSYGKPEAGILQGNVNWMGDFDGCRDIRVPANDTITGGFRGMYCKLSISLNLKNQSIPLEIGTCQPDSCLSTDLKIFLENQLDRKISVPLPMLKTSFDLKEIFTKVNFFCHPLEKPLTTGAKIVIFIISIFVSLAVIGSSFTVYEFLSKEKTTQTVNSDIHLVESNAKDLCDQTPDPKPEVVVADAKDSVNPTPDSRPEVVVANAADKKQDAEFFFSGRLHRTLLVTSLPIPPGSSPLSPFSSRSTSVFLSPVCRQAPMLGPLLGFCPGAFSIHVLSTSTFFF